MYFGFDSAFELALNIAPEQVERREYYGIGALLLGLFSLIRGGVGMVFLLPVGLPYFAWVQQQPRWGLLFFRISPVWSPYQTDSGRAFSALASEPILALRLCMRD